MLFDIDRDAASFVAAIADRLELQAVAPRRVRAVTHLDVDRAAIDQALHALRAELGVR